MKTTYVIVVYNHDHQRIHESAPFDEYPSETSILFGLNLPNVSYARVETRYGKGERHEQIST